MNGNKDNNGNHHKSTNNSSNSSNNNVTTSSHQFKRKLIYASILFGVCYIQIATNFFVYHFQNKNHHRQVQQRGGVGMTKENEKKPSSPLSTTSIQQRSLFLESKLEAFHALQLESSETRGRTTSSSGNDDETDFFPFTIRDSRRAGPIQVPHGFHIFDTAVHLVDPYVVPTPSNYQTTLYYDGHPLVLPSSDGEDEYGCPSHLDGYNLHCYRSKILHVLQYLLQTTNAQYYFYMESDNDLCTTLSHIRDIAFTYRRYFISTGIGFSGWIMSRQFVSDFYEWYKLDFQQHQQQQGDHDGETSDPDGSVNASHADDTYYLRPEVMASILLNKKRGWSVTRQYLTSHSVLGGWRGEDSLTELFEINENINSMNNSRIQRNGTLPLGSVAVNTSKPDTSESNGQDNGHGHVEEEDQNNDKSTNKTAPGYIPIRHLPRCLEPHRGIWPTPISTSIQQKKQGRGSGENGDDTSNNDDKGSAGKHNDDVFAAKKDDGQQNHHQQHDMLHWDYFVYDWCPDSPIFPCQEGQLDALIKSKNDTTLHNRINPSSLSSTERHYQQRPHTYADGVSLDHEPSSKNLRGRRDVTN